MAVTTYNIGRESPGLFSSIRWRRAIQASLIVGAILFLVNHGIPWVGSGAVNPSVMGREIAPGQTPGASFTFTMLGVHFALAVVYGLILAPIVHGFRPWVAGLVGAVAGLVLYFINYAVSGMIMDMPANQAEWPSIIHHVVFGLVFAETYKGMVRRRAEPAS